MKTVSKANNSYSQDCTICTTRVTVTRFPARASVTRERCNINMKANITSIGASMSKNEIANTHVREQ
jgi:predicted nucleic acid-binding Zn ribbon protein